MTSDSILVLGGTGTVGKPLLKALKEKNADFTVFARDAHKVEQLCGPGIKSVTGDVSDIESFKSAVAGKTRLFLLTNNPPHEGIVAQAAADAGVKHIVKLSVIGASIGDPPGSIMHSHGLAEQALVAIPNVKWTILRPHFFMQNLLAQKQAFKGHEPYINASPDSYVSAIDVRDIADVAATVLTEPIEKHAGLTYSLTGPKAHNISEMLQIVGKACGKDIPLKVVGDEEQFEDAVKRGTPRPLALAFVQLSQYYRVNLDVPWATGDVKIVTGKPARSLEQFVADHKDELTA